MRVLDPVLVVNSLAHQRALVFDFWRGVAKQLGKDNAFDSNPYDFAVELRWDHLVREFSTCIFAPNNALQMVS